MPEDAGSIYSSIYLKLDELQRGVTKVHTILNGMSKKSQKKAGGFASFWRNAFQTAFGVGVVQIINKVTQALRGALDVFSGFQQSMRNVQSVTGATGEEFRKMNEAAKEAGETTRFTAREAADALYYLGSAGFTAQQSISALDGVLQLAGATQSDLASTSETVASIISQYSLQASDATRVSNVFAAAITNSQATMQKLSTSFRQVGPVAAGFGYTLEQTTGILQELYNAGFQGQQAGRALKSALADLASPTANMEKIFSRLGISLDKVNPATTEFSDIIDILANSGATTADIIDAFGKVAGPQMAVLIKQGGDALRKYTEDVTNTNAAAEAYKIQNDSLAGSLDFLKSKLESTAIAIFEKLEPGMRDLIDSFIEFLDATRPVGEALGFILNIMLELASISTGAITALFTGIFSQFEKSKTPLEKASENFDKVREAIQKTGELTKTISRLDDLNRRYDELSKKSELSKDEQDELKDIISDITDIIPEAATAFDEYGNAIALNSEKTKEATQRLLESKKAILLEAKTRLELQKPILEGILRQDKAEADLIKRRRENLAREGNIAETRLSLIETFNLKYNALVKEGIEPTTAFLQVNEELSEQLNYVGIKLETTGGKMRILGQGFKQLNAAEDEATKTLYKLQDALKEESEVEIRVKDAEKSLKELADLENELKAVNEGLKGLKKSTDDAGTGAEEYADKSKDFWANFRSELEKATREAALFGEKQDVIKEKLNFLKKAYLDLLNEGMNPESETLTKIRQEYDLLLIELNALIESEKGHTEALGEKTKVNEDVIAMTEEYRRKLEELGATDAELLEIERIRAKEAVIAAGASRDAEIAALEAIDAYYNALKENSTSMKEDFKINIDEMLSYAHEFANALIALFQAITDSRLEELDREMQAELEAAGLAEETERERLERERQEAIEAGDEELAREKENDLKRLDIEEEYERKKAEIQYKAELNTWQLKLAAVLASVAKAIAEALAVPPPGNVPAVAYASAVGGLQIATVYKQKPTAPAFETGGIYPGPATPGNANAELHPGEMILTPEQQRNLFNSINAGNVGTSQTTQITVIFELAGEIIYQGVQTAQHNGIIRFKADRLI